MNKPSPSRKSDVTSKLAYADKRRNDVMEELFAAKKEDRDPAFLIHAASDVMSVSRECFDYLGQDILEGYILPNEPKTKKAHDAGKVKAYFPFHAPQLTNTKAVFHSLKTIAPALYKELLEFTEAIQERKLIDKTLFNFHDFLSMKDMVNEKKHHKLLATVANSNQELLIEKKGFALIMPFKKRKGLDTLTVSAGLLVKHVAEYRFAYNDKEVGYFCLFAVKASETIITRIYARHFA